MKVAITHRAHHSVFHGDEDLYQKYCRFTDDARRQVVLDHPPGPDRNSLLKIWQPVHRERFEAKLEAFAKLPGKLERVIYLLNRGFDPSF